MLVTQPQINEPLDNNFAACLTAGDTRASKILLDTRDEGQKSLLAAKPIARGETILTLAGSQLLTAAEARKSAIGNQLIKAGIDEQAQQIFLAVYMLQQLSCKNSPWSAYLQDLPENFYQNPLYYPGELLTQLHSSPALEMILTRKFNLEQDYRRLMQIPSIKHYSLAQYFWIRTAIDSRHFCLGGDLVMAPVLDSINHSCEPNASYEQGTAKASLKLISLKDIAKGEEITCCYDGKSNRHFFSRYGFMPKKEHFNSARITLALNLSDPLLREKMALLEIGEYAQDIEIGPAAPTGFAKAMCFARISTAKQLQENLSCYRLPSNKLDEIVALQAFLQSCRQMLSIYDTVKAPPLSDKAMQQNQKTCQTLLAREKQTLMHYALFSSTALTFLTHGNSVDYIRQEIEPDYQAQLLALFQLPVTATEEVL